MTTNCNSCEQTSALPRGGAREVSYKLYEQTKGNLYAPRVAVRGYFPIPLDIVYEEDTNWGFGEPETNVYAITPGTPLIRLRTFVGLDGRWWVEFIWANETGREQIIFIKENVVCSHLENLTYCNNEK